MTSLTSSITSTRTPGARATSIVLGGAALAAGYPPFSVAPLAWIALVPLLLQWTDRQSSRGIFVDAYATFLITFAAAFHWPILHVNAETALLSLPPLLVIPMWMAVPFGLSHAARRRLGPSAGLLLLVALFVLMEWGIRRGPFAFPWTLLGHTQSSLYPVSELARFGGVPLLTVFVFVLNVWVLSLVRPLRAVRWTSAGAALVMAGAAVAPPSAQSGGPALRIGLVQPAVPAAAWAELDDPSRVDVLMHLSDSIMTASPSVDALPIDLVVWPETALPPDAPAVRRRVQRWVDVNGVPLVTGSIDSEGAAVYNAAALFLPGGRRSVYRKRRLVPFAEHVPFQDRWPWVRRLAVPSGGVPGYARGTSSSLMEISGAPFGVLICFETLFDDAAREYARRGADFIVAITQDGWWGDSFGYRQHLAFTRLRAVETGMPLVQVSVSGLTAVIRPDGAIERRIGWMEREGVLSVVQTGSVETPYVRFGDWVPPAALVAALLSVVIALGHKRS